MDKYIIPKIPTTQQVLEDIFNEEVVPVNKHSVNVHDGDETLLGAYFCYKNIMQLQEDVIEQDGLSSKLDELNQKLVENIANMKKQT